MKIMKILFDRTRLSGIFAPTMKTTVPFASAGMAPKLCAILLNLAALCVPLSAQSLDQALRLMLYNEPEIQAANYDRLSAQEDWKIARGAQRPQVALDGSTGYVQRDRSLDGAVQSTGDGLLSRQIGVSVRQLLYDGGATRHQTLAAADGIYAQELLERGMLEGRVVDLCEVYFEVLRAREQVREAQTLVDRHKEIREMIKARAAADGNRADLALVDGRLSLAVNSTEDHHLALENALIRFVRLTGRPANQFTRPQVPHLPDSQSGLVLGSNWDFLAAQAALEVAQHKLESAKGNRGPRIHLDAGGSVGEDVLGIEGRDNEARALLTMSWDLYSGGSNSALRQREHWQMRKAEELVRAASEESEYRAALLWKEREGSKASEKSLGAYVERLEGVLSDYQEQLKVGHQEILNILDVQSELYQAKNKLIDARYNTETSVFRIMGVQGVLAKQLLGEDEIQAYLDRNPDTDRAPQDLMPVHAVENRDADTVIEVSREDFLEDEKRDESRHKKLLRKLPFVKKR